MYVSWLASSSHARDEFAQKNNHGTWFDVQAITLSLHTSNASWSRFMANNAKSRIATQVASNGTLPLELVRTRSMHYTWWDLSAFFELALAAELLGVNIFDFTAGPGQSLRHAVDFVAPYTVFPPVRPWPWEEETPFDHGKFFLIYRVASLKWANASYEKLITRLPGTVNYTTSTINLLWPRIH